MLTLALGTNAIWSSSSWFNLCFQFLTMSFLPISFDETSIATVTFLVSLSGSPSILRICNDLFAVIWSITVPFSIISNF